MSKKMSVDDCIRELKVHGLACQKVGLDGEKRWGLSELAVLQLAECLSFAREHYPNEAEEDIAIRAMIMLVVNKLGLVNAKHITDFVNAIKLLAANDQEGHRIDP